MSALDSNYSFSIGGNSKSRQSTKLFVDSCKALCLAQIAASVVCAILSQQFLFDELKFTGLVLSGILAATGGVGLYGSLKKNRDLLNFHIVGAILAIVLSSQFNGQLDRDIHVDCAFSELHLRTQALTEVTEHLAKQEMFSSVHERLMELEDTINAVEMGMTETISFLKNGGQAQPNQHDKEYIHSKIQMIRFHAHKILDEMHTAVNADGGSKWHNMTEKEQEMVRLKIQTSQNILQRIEQHDQDSKQHPFSAEEYEQMLRTLIYVIQHENEHDMDTARQNDLNSLSDHLESTKGAIQRSQEHGSYLSSLHEDVTLLSETARENREKYKEQYLEMLKRSRERGQKDVGAFALEYMPEHCVKELTGASYLVVVGYLIMALSLATVYICLCVSFRIPVKSE